MLCRVVPQLTLCCFVLQLLTLCRFVLQLTNEQIAGRVIRTLSMTNIEKSALQVELASDEQYGHRAVIVKALTTNSVLAKQGGC